MNPRFTRVDVELTQVNQICIKYHVTDQLRMSSRLDLTSGKLVGPNIGSAGSSLIVALVYKHVDIQMS